MDIEAYFIIQHSVIQKMDLFLNIHMYKITVNAVICSFEEEQTAWTTQFFTCKQYKLKFQKFSQFRALFI